MSVEQLAVVEIGAVLVIALFFGLIFTRFKQSSAIGYILAGLVLGPLGLHYLVPGVGVAQIFGEIGLLMLMFYLGLELNLKHFVEHGALATSLAALEMALTFAVGFSISKLFGFADLEAIVIGAVLMATSTAVVGKFLIDRRLFSSPVGSVAHSILVLEDFVAILVLVFITSVATAKSFNNMALTALFFVVAVLFVVARLSRRILKYLRFREREAAIAFYAIGVGLIVAWLGVLLGLPATLGAYFVGFALAETVYGKRVKQELGFLREFFVLFFFVSFGSTLFFDTSVGAAIVLNAGQWLFLVGVAVALAVGYFLVKFFAYGIFGTALGLRPRTAIGVGMVLLPLGEFAVIIALAAKPLLSAAAFALLLPLTFLLILLTTPSMAPLYDRSSKLAAFFERFYPRSVRKRLSFAGRELQAFKRFSTEETRTRFGHTIVSLVVNFLAVIAVLFISNALTAELEFPWISVQFPLSAIILLIVVWPLFNMLHEMRTLVHFLESQLIYRVRPHPSSKERFGVKIFTNLLLVAIGIIAAFICYAAFPQMVFIYLVPVAYTLLAVFEFARMVVKWHASASA